MIYQAVDPKELRIDARELARRLGMPSAELDDGMAKCLDRLLTAAKPAYAATHVKINRSNGAITIGGAKSESKGLDTFCQGCDECIALAATIGVGVDRLILKSATVSAHDAFVIDAMADALIEALCDYAQDALREGLTVRGRFSPGYSDLDLSFGKEILILTDAERMLGIKLTESGMMVPRKSVNAIIAIKSV